MCHVCYLLPLGVGSFDERMKRDDVSRQRGGHHRIVGEEIINRGDGSPVTNSVARPKQKEVFSECAHRKSKGWFQDLHDRKSSSSPTIAV